MTTTYLNDLASRVNFGTTPELNFRREDILRSAEEASLLNPSRVSFQTKESPAVLHKNKSVRTGLPSVTKIINVTMPEIQRLTLERWEQRMIEKLGEGGFKKYRRNMLKRGTQLHSHIEHYMMHNELLDAVAEDDEEEMTIKNNHLKSVAAVLPDFTYPAALECRVSHPTLGYTGVVDCIACYKGKLALIDWKTSEKPKRSLKDTYDSPLQVAAYVGAINHDSSYDVQVSLGLLVIVYNDGEDARVLRIPEKKLAVYWQDWLKRVEAYKRLTAIG